MQGLRSSTAFTLLEMTIVLVLAAILAIAAVPRLSHKDQLYSIGYQTQLITLLRYTQLRAMQRFDNADFCPQVALGSDRFGNPANMNATCTVPTLTNLNALLAADTGVRSRVSIIDDAEDVKLEMRNLANTGLLVLPADIRFDRMGRPLNTCASGCRVAIQETRLVANKDELVREVFVCIETQGYIHDC